MKKVVGFIAVLALITAALTLAACSKKRTVTLEPSDVGSVSTSTFTNTPTSTHTPTETYTVPPGSTNTFTNTATQTYTRTATATATATPPAHPTGWIDDLEDPYAPNQNDFQVSGPSMLNTGGYWITYDDNSKQNNGSSYVWPIAETWAARKGITHVPFEVSSPGYPGSPYGTNSAARVSGYAAGCTGGSGNWWEDTTCTGAGTIVMYIEPSETQVFRFGFFGMGCQLTPTAGEGNTGFTLGVTTAAGIIDDPNDCAEVNVTAYTGIRFWYKADGTAWRIKIPFTNQLNCDGKWNANMPAEVTITAAIMATANYTAANDIGFTINTTATDWTMVEIPFIDMKFENYANQSLPLELAPTCTAPGGDCTRATILQHVKQIQFQTFGDPGPTNSYPVVREFWVDDIQLY